jgi:phage shock protein A
MVKGIAAPADETAAFARRAPGRFAAAGVAAGPQRTRLCRWRSPDCGLVAAELSTILASALIGSDAISLYIAGRTGIVMTRRRDIGLARAPDCKGARLRIAIFNERMDARTGGQINARDWCLGLKTRGHDVVLYTLSPGVLAAEVRAAGVSVVDDPAKIADAPDIIFGGGLSDVVTMLARFPNVPAVQICQQWDSWENFPGLLPQVMFYVVVDAINAEMVVNEFGVPRERVRLVHNAVDLARLPARQRALAGKPERGIVFVKHHWDYADALRTIGARRNISFDFVGYDIDNPVDDPLSAIVHYDLVIGTARTAIEGAVAGSAVIVADYRGLGGLVTTANVELFRKHNFGREMLKRQPCLQHFEAAIDAYDADDARAVSEFMKEHASLDRQIDALEAVFVEAIERFRRVPPAAEACQTALAAYLSRHLPRAGEASPRHAQERLGSTMHEVSDSVTSIKYRLATVEAGLAARAVLAEEVAQVTRGVVDVGHRIGTVAAEAADQVSQVAQRVDEVDRRIFAIEALFDRNRPLMRAGRPFAVLYRKIYRFAARIASYLQ